MEVIMANVNQVEMLQRSVREFNAWRVRNPEERVNLKGANLTGANLREADLTGVNRMGANLTEANLMGADLMGADLRRAHLTRAHLTRAHLTGAILSGAILPEEWVAKCSADILSILRLPALNGEVAFTRRALEAGEVDGSVYNGVCACLMGTLANTGGESMDAFCERVGRQKDANSPAERFFSTISLGDTAESNPCVAIALNLCDQVLTEKAGL